MERKYIGLVLILLAVSAGFFLLKRLNFYDLVDSRHAQDIQNIQELVIKDQNCDAALAKTANLIKRNPADKDAWHWQGICQFQLDRIADARQSFEKVIALNSKNQAAKNYLELMSSGATLVNLQKDGISREAFESLSLVRLQASFDFAYAYPVEQGGVTVTTGKYTTGLSGKRAQAELEKSLKSAGLSYTSENGSAAGIKSYEASLDDVSYKISINVLSTPVNIAINITSTK